MFEITFSNNYCGCDIVEEFENCTYAIEEVKKIKKKCLTND